MFHRALIENQMHIGDVILVRQDFLINLYSSSEKFAKEWKSSSFKYWDGFRFNFGPRFSAPEEELYSEDLFRRTVEEHHSSMNSSVAVQSENNNDIQLGDIDLTGPEIAMSVYQPQHPDLD